MAIGQSDGSIVLDLTVNDQGLKKETKNLKSEAAKLAAEYRKAGMSQSEAFKKAWSEIERTKVSTDKVTVSTKKFGQQSQTTGTQASAAISKIGLGLKSLLAYFIGIQTVFAAIRFSGASAEFATQTEASVQRLVDIYGSASDSVGNFIDANARALGMSKAAAASFSSVYGNLFSVWADQATNAELTNQYLQMTAVVASKTGRTVEDVQERVRSGLLGNTEAIEDLGIFVNVKTIEMTDAFQRMADGKSWEQLDAYTQQQIRSMAILEQATAKYGDEVADTSATIRNRYKAAYEDFQNSWGNIVNTVLLPVLETLTQIFDIATKGLNALSGRSGQILENVELQEESTDKTAENIEEQTQNQKELNKELKKSLASFDEINLLTNSTSNNLDGGSGTAGELNTISSNTSNISQEIDPFIAKIMGYVGAGLAAIGIILVCFGNISWGIGFIIAGAATFKVSEAALKEGEAEEEFNKLHDTIFLASGLMLLIGIVLVCCGVVTPMSVGLIVAGAAGMASEVAFNWNYLKTKIEQVAKENKGLMVLGSALLVVLGIALLFTGVGVPFGLAWIAAGAQGISTGETGDWDFLPKQLKTVWETIKRWWRGDVAPVLSMAWWKAVAVDCGNGLIAGFEAAVNSIIILFESMINLVSTGLNNIKIEIPDWDILGDLAGKKFGVNIPKAKLKRLSIPRLAQGGVIPPNREFLAVLGDNKRENEIVSPVSTIKQAVAEALASASVSGSGVNGRIEVPVIINGREVMRAIREVEDSAGSRSVYGGFANVR